MENAIQLFFRVSHGLSVQRGEPAAATGGRGEFLEVSGVCEFERGAGKEIRVSRVLVGGADRGGQCAGPPESERGGEQYRCAEFRDVYRGAGTSVHGASAVCG